MKRLTLAGIISTVSVFAFSLNANANIFEDFGETLTEHDAFVNTSSVGSYYTEDVYKEPKKKHLKVAHHTAKYRAKQKSYSSRMPSKIKGYGEKVIIVNPRKHAWGAYSSDGRLLRSGLATSGGNWCKDVGRACRTPVGSYRIKSLGSSGCKSSRYPKPRGGAPMPYCMFFNGNIGLHGSYNVVDGNRSHGCVRLKVADAKWIRFNFARIGTKVVVKPY